MAGSNGHPRPAKPAAGHFATFNALIDGPLLAALTDAELRVLLVFVRHATAEGIAFPGPDLIARKTGMRVRSVKRAMSALRTRGVLVSHGKAGGRGNVQFRRVVITEPSTNSDRAVTVYDDTKGDATGSQTVTAEARNSDRRRSQTVTVGSPEGLMNIQGTNHQQHSGGDGAGGLPSDEEEKDEDPDRIFELRQALVNVGINNPTRDRIIAKVKGLTAEAVEHLNSENEGGTGLLVTTIESEGERVAAELAEARCWREEAVLAAEAKAAEQKVERERYRLAFEADHERFEKVRTEHYTLSAFGMCTDEAIEELGLAYEYDGSRRSVPKAHRGAVLALTVLKFEAVVRDAEASAQRIREGAHAAV